MASSRFPSVDELVDGIIHGDRARLAQAITRVESRRPDHEEQAQELLSRLLPRTGGAKRIGITGVPGVGKSTFIEALGKRLVADGARLAVLAIDPSSGRTGGSVLGDKTRMAELAQHKQAFIRPSPAAATLGGVARRTRESMLLCEAAGFDVIVVETVGVGQSEVQVAEMVDTFLLLMLPGAGDELQGIKKGVIEMADVIAVNKSDGDNLNRAREARRELSAALRYLPPKYSGWRAPVVNVSSLTASDTNRRDTDGAQMMDKLWDCLEAHRRFLTEEGHLQKERSAQSCRWMWSMVEERVIAGLRTDEAVSDVAARVEPLVSAGKMHAPRAAAELIAAYRSRS